MTTQHTQTPWAMKHGESNYQKGKIYIKHRDSNLDWHMIATITADGRQAEREANADFIVKRP